MKIDEGQVAMLKDALLAALNATKGAAVAVRVEICCENGQSLVGMVGASGMSSSRAMDAVRFLGRHDNFDYDFVVEAKKGEN